VTGVRFALALLLLASCAAPPTSGAAGAGNVLFVTIDGLRWQEVFEGAEEALFTKEAGGVKDAKALREDFWRETPEARREALMPFLWGVMAKQGQVFGNGKKNCPMRVTNGHSFSYPGYAEMLCGFADARVDSNKKIPNPNVTVLEWLHRRPGFEGRVAAYCTWDVFPAILNRERSGLPVHCGPPTGDARLDALYADLPALWKDCWVDALEFHAGMDYVRAKKPRVFYLAFGETDEWAHAGFYDQYLHAARRCDDFLRRLWEAVQAMPEYRGRTSLVVTADHGRGDAPVEWKSHGAKVKGAEYVWAAVLGPGVPALGERTDLTGLTQSQIAATLARLVGEDYRGDVSKAAPALPTSRH
jgi:type I phosphodiesterase/nucleotide pyrophosphatase